MTTAAGAVLDAKNPELEQETAALITTTQQLVVTDASTYALAGERMTGLVGLKKRVEEWFAPLVEQAYKTHKALTSRRAMSVKPIDTEIDRLKRQMSTWKTEQDRQQRERERELALQAQREEQTRMKAEAALLERQGQPELAAAVLETAIATPAPTVVLPSSVPKVAGVSYRTTYKWRVLNPALVPRSFLIIDEKKLTAYADAMKGAARGTVPGIEFYEAEVPVARGA